MAHSVGRVRQPVRRSLSLLETTRSTLVKLIVPVPPPLIVAARAGGCLSRRAIDHCLIASCVGRVAGGSIPT